MKSKHHLSLFKCKLFKPCKKFLHLFKFKLHKPLFIPSLHHRKHNIQSRTQKWRFSKILSVFRYQRDTREMDRVTELTSFSDAPHPSPLTPLYTRMSGAMESDDDDVEDACRSFDKYLKEMMVEDGKMRDLVDVEELLYCWKNLTSPVFLDLLCRFYRELCKDLFSNTSHNDIVS